MSIKPTGVYYWLPFRTRLGHSQNHSKCLVEVGGKPLLADWIVVEGD